MRMVLWLTRATRLGSPPRSGWDRSLAAGLVLTLVLLSWLSGALAGLTPAGATGSAPQRVVSLYPTATDTLVALGLSERLVGVTFYDQVPPPAQPTVVGGLLAPDLEAIARLQPDLIIICCEWQKEVKEHFQALGVRVLELPADQMAGILKNLEDLGQLFQCPEAARALADQFTAKLELIRQKVARIPPEHRLRVVRLMSDKKMLAPGDDSFQNEFIRQAGGIPPTWGQKGGAVPLTPEAWRRFDPQVIYYCASTPEKMQALLQQPEWREVSAVREGRIYRFPCELACRTSVQAADFVAWLASVLYPKEFADPKQQIQPDRFLGELQPVALPLSYVKKARLVRSRVRDFEHKSLVVDFTAPQEVLSTLEGWRQGITTVGNHYTPPPGWSLSHYLGLARDRETIFKALGQDPKTTSFLFTGANMSNLAVKSASFRELQVFALVTAGVESNALRLSREEGRYYEPGTINIIVLTNHKLAHRAMSRLLIDITEAKTAALQDLDIRSTDQAIKYQATGTGTDNIIVVSGQGRELKGAGGHTKLGELVATAVYQGVTEAVLKQNGLRPRRPIWERLQERQISLYNLVQEAVPEAQRRPVLAAWEAALLQSRYAGFLEAALALSDAAERGQVLDLQAYKLWCQAVAQELAGKPLSSAAPKLTNPNLPLPLQAACEAFLQGLTAKSQP